MKEEGWGRKWLAAVPAANVTDGARRSAEHSGAEPGKSYRLRIRSRTITPFVLKNWYLQDRTPARECSTRYRCQDGWEVTKLRGVGIETYARVQPENAD